MSEDEPTAAALIATLQVPIHQFEQQRAAIERQRLGVPPTAA
jgi:hypothetical protein